MAATVTTFLASEIKIKWQEAFLTEGLNAHMATALPTGVFRGFYISSTATNLRLSIDPDTTGNDHVATYVTSIGSNEYSLKIRRTGGSFTVDIPIGYLNQTVYLALYAAYATSTTTSAELRVYSLAEYAAAPEKNDLVILGTVVVPSVSSVIPALNISYANRRWAWLHSPTQGVRWTHLLRNSDFEWGHDGTVGAPLPYWENTVSAVNINIPGTLVSTDSFSGHRSMQWPNDSPGGGLTGVLAQYLNRPVDSSKQKQLRIKVAVKSLGQYDSGTVSIAARFTDKTNTTTFYQTLDISGELVNGSWVYLEKYIAIPTDINTQFLQYVGLDFDTLLFTLVAPGSPVLRVDALQCWIEERTVDTAILPAERNAAEGRYWGLVFEDQFPTHNTACLKFDSTTGVDGFGGLVLTNQSKDVTTLSAAPRLVVRSLEVDSGDRSLGGQFRFSLAGFGGRGSVDLLSPGGLFSLAPAIRAAQIELESNPGLAVDSARLLIPRSDAVGGYPKRTLVLESGAAPATGTVSRMYRAALAIGSERFEITANAKWDPIGMQWSQDDGTKASRLTSFRDDGMEVQVMPAGSGPWGSWSGTSYFSLLPIATAPTLRLLNGEIRLDTPGSFSNPARSTNSNGSSASATLDANSLYAKGIPKAWGTFNDIGGSVTVFDAYGVDSIVTVSAGNSTQVNFINAMTDTNYSVVALNRTGSNWVNFTGSYSTSSFQFATLLGSTGAVVTSRSLSFVVFGPQS